MRGGLHSSPMLKNLGQQIRKIRKSKGVTLIDLSKKTGVAQATLSRIETGTMTGTLESHERIADALGVGLVDLYADLDRRYDNIAHLTLDQQKKVTHQPNGIQLELLTQESSKKKITPLRITLKPGAKSGPQQQERGVEKFFYVLEGQVLVRVEQDEFELKVGETLYFDASLTHQILNEKSKTARVLVAVSPSKI